MGTRNMDKKTVSRTMLAFLLTCVLLLSLFGPKETSADPTTATHDLGQASANSTPLIYVYPGYSGPIPAGTTKTFHVRSSSEADKGAPHETTEHACMHAEPKSEPEPEPVYMFITFDDDSEATLNNALPIMEEFGFKGITFFATKWHLGSLQHFADAGWEIGAHTYSHPHLNNVLEEQLYEEIVQPKIDIEKNVRNVNEVITFAYPFGEGYDNATVASLVNATYRYIRPRTRARIGGKTFDVGKEESCISNIEKAIEYVKNGTGNAWLMFHTISDVENPSSYYWLSLSTFREALQLIADAGLTARAHTSTSCSLSSTSVNYRESVEISATVSFPCMQPSDGTITLECTTNGVDWTLVSSGTPLSGSYSYTWTPPSGGTFYVRAVWSGNYNYLGSTSSNQTLTVWSVHNLNTGLGYVMVQEAIDAPETLGRHTISVDAGTYYETISVRKTLSLVGENRESTMIEGGIMVDWADGCVIEGFTIRSVDSNGIWILGSSNAIISGNNILDNWVGVHVVEVSDITVSGNNIANNDAGIVFQDAARTIVSGNNMTGNGAGIVNWADYWASYSLISGNNISYNSKGIELNYARGNVVSTNNIMNNDIGIVLSSSEWGYFNNWDNTISGNDIVANGQGIILYAEDTFLGRPYRTFDNVVFENNFADNNYAVCLDGVYSEDNNSFYHNSFFNNAQHVYIEMPSYASVWDDGYPSGGNYWSELTGSDTYRGPYQNETGSDGIGDVPYMMDANNTDFYPLMKPYGGQYDIGIVSLNCSKTVVGQGYTLTVTVEVINYEINDETFNVIIYANASIIQTQAISLTSRNSTVVSFNWNTTGFAYGNYTMRAVADTILGETDTADNIFIDGMVSVTVTGDVDGDGDVDGFDLNYMCGAYGATLGHPGWDGNCDVNGDGIIDGFDLTLTCGNYGKTV